MPRVTLWDIMNTAYRCDTLDPDILAVWLSEWTSRLAVTGMTLRMSVYPLPKGPLHDFDWPADNRFIGVTFPVPDEPSQIILAMNAERKRIEREIAKLGPGQQPADG
jgi:hypothetical protein